MSSRRRCDWRRVRCYAPSLVCAAGLALVCAWGVWALHDRDIENIRTRHIVNAFLLWFVMTPVIIGTLRGIRRSTRHLTRPR